MSETAQLSAIAALSSSTRPLPAAALCMGARGVWRELPFQIVAHVQLSDRSGLAHHWSLRFEDGSSCSLLEQEGRCRLAQSPEQVQLPLHFDHLTPGTELDMGGVGFVVERRRISSICKAEGVTTLTVGDDIPWVELRSDAGSVLVTFNGVQQHYELQDVAVADLQLTLSHRSEFAVSLAACPACKHELSFAATDTAFGRCPNCSSLLDLTEQPAALLQPGAGETVKSFTLPLGQTGQLSGARYVVLGAYDIHSHLDGDDVRRTDYLLYHPRHKFLWLTEHDDGTWFLHEPCDHWPKANGQVGWLDGTKFEFLRNHVATVGRVAGALNFLVESGDRIHQLEYRASGLGGGTREGAVLLRRGTDETLDWSVCNPITAKEVLRAFDVEAPPVVQRKAKPKAIKRTTFGDLAGPLRLATYGNLVLLVLHPTLVGAALAAGAVLGVVCLGTFSWMFEGEKL